MSGAQHTPGPWVGMVNGKFNSDHDYCVEHTKARSLEYAPIWADERVIALVVHTQDTFSLRSSPSMQANASLIAAAPDLLEALQLLMTDGRIGGSNGARARAAIAKATGGAA